MARMTKGQWRQRLGDAVSLEEAPARFGLPSMTLLMAVKTGKVPLHTFRAADGRVFRMVKTRDVQAFQTRATHTPPTTVAAPAPTAAQPAITMDGMKAAFREMAES